VEQYASTTSMKRESKRTILDASRFLPGGDPDQIQYHENVLIPTARNVELEEAVIMDYDTLSLERAVFNKVFAHNWTSLNENERLHFLEESGWELDQNTSIKFARIPFIL
jgi:hypothetical protein